MKILIKLILLLIFAVIVGVVAYAYIGPYLGADFSAPSEEIRIPVILDGNS